MKTFYTEKKVIKKIALDYDDVIALLLKDKPKNIYCIHSSKSEPHQIIYKYLDNGVMTREYYNDGYGDNGYNTVFMTYEDFYNKYLDPYPGLLETLYY